VVPFRLVFFAQEKTQRLGERHGIWPCIRPSGITNSRVATPGARSRVLGRDPLREQ
jgi:hypothetical protein